MNQSSPLVNHAKAMSKRRSVHSVFRRVAQRYDFMNDLMSFGAHRLWKQHMVNSLVFPAKKEDFLLLDTAGGTGDIAMRAFNKRPENFKAIIADCNINMLAQAQKRPAITAHNKSLHIACINAQDLAFPDNTFHAYTIAFGMRNIKDRPKALREAWRVLKYGGQFLCLEFARPALPLLDTMYNSYAQKVIPALGKMVVKDAKPYRYLVESIKQYPPRGEFMDMVSEAGFTAIKYQDLTGGIVTLTVAWKG